MLKRIFAGLMLGAMALCSVATSTLESEVGYIYSTRVVSVYDSLEVHVTWYTSTVEECDSTPFITADGSRVRHGIIAVSRDLLETFSYGDSLYVDGFGWYEVHDTMNARWTSRVDIWTDSRYEAIQNGKQRRAIRWGYRCSTTVVRVPPS